MPIRALVLPTLAALALANPPAPLQAQQPGQARFGIPMVSPPASVGIVTGLPEDDSGPALAQLAAESNLWLPCCEPPTPSRGLWGDRQTCAPACSWQERCMTCRDRLGWVFSRPNCCCGVSPPSDASAWDWLTQWLRRDRIAQEHFTGR